MTLGFTAFQDTGVEAPKAAPKPDFIRPAVRGQAYQPTYRPNRFAQDCIKCGTLVAEGSGLIDRQNGRWVAFHKEGDCVAAKPMPKEQGKTGDVVSEVVVEFQTGLYTVEHEGAPSGHYTFKVILQPSDADFAPGATVVEYLIGRDNDNDYKGFAFIRKGVLVFWKKYRGDDSVALREAAQKLLNDEGVLEAKHCLRCGRTLTTPDSIAAGIGPECSKKGLR